jgi:exonuclease VII large subunit
LFVRERRLNAEVARLQSLLPMGRLARYDEHVRQACRRLAATLHQSLTHRGRLLRTRMEAIAACDPKRVLRRGYSVTRAARTRRVLKSVEEIKDAMRIVTQLADGEFKSTADDPRQPGLFD